MTYPTPDAAIRAAKLHSPLDAHGLDPRRVAGDRMQAAEAIDMHGQIWAVLGRLPQPSRDIVVLYACRWSYRDIAQRLGISYSTVRRRHHPAREAVHHRLIELGICPPRERT